MEVPGSPREQSPAVTSIVISGQNHRKRKHAAVASVAASSPAPSDRGGTPNPGTDNIVLPSRHLDLSARPRLTISRHPSFVPIASGSPYNTTEPLCNNRLNFRYTPAGLSAPDCTLPFRTIESNPTSFRVSWEDRSPFVKVTEDGLGLRGERGFRSVRCNAPVREGKWYMEVKIEQGGGEKPTESKRLEGSHVRLGWARREAPLNAPAGLDGYSYAMRDKSGEKVHLSRPRPYGKPFRSGDVIGMYISLPSPRRKPNPKDPYDPAHIKRERIAIEFKGQEYFESLEYSQSKEMLSLMDANDRGKTSSSTPAPSSTKKSATVKNLPSTSRGAKTGPSEPSPMRPLPTLGPESCVAFFVNGESQGIAFQNLYDYLPLRKPQGKTQEKKRANREGYREHKENPFDDGSLGYYPFISLFNEARVRLNPGPNFEYPPPPNIDSVLVASDSMDTDIKPLISEGDRKWRPLCERYSEYMSEQFALDDMEEAGAHKQQQGIDNHEKTDAQKRERFLAKRRAQAAARKERKKTEMEQVEAVAREEKRRKLEESPLPLPEIAMDYVESALESSALPTTSLDDDVANYFTSVDQAHSPAPTVTSSIDPNTPWGGGHDTSGYNTECEEVNEDGEGEPEQGDRGTVDLGFEDELALAAGVD